jgi:hypothetical protein
MGVSQAMGACVLLARCCQLVRTEAASAVGEGHVMGFECVAGIGYQCFIF